MKITVCTTQKFEPPLVGGVDVYTERLARALLRQGHTVTIIALDGAADVADSQITMSEAVEGDFAVSRLHFSFAKRPKKAFDTAYDPEMGAQIRTILAAQQPDLFIILNFYMLTLAAAEAAKSLQIPVAHVATDFLPICRRGTFIRWHNGSCEVGESVKSCAECFVSHNPMGKITAAFMNKMPVSTLSRWATRRDSYIRLHPFAALQPYWQQIAIMEERLQRLAELRPLIDHVFVPTQYTQRIFLQNGFTPAQVHHIPFGVDPTHPLANCSHTSAGHRRFLFIGRLQPYKGADILLKAFNNLQSPRGATLTIYGAADDGYQDYFQALEAMIAANDNVQFLGKIPPAELATAFADADYFLLPSTWHENMPLILLDALQSNTPVIVSDIGGVTDVVHHEKNGLLFPLGDVAALQHTLQRAIDEPQLVEKLRAGMELLTIDAYAAQMLDICFAPEKLTDR